MVMLQLKGFILKFLPVDALPAAAPQPDGSAQCYEFYFAAWQGGAA